MDHHAGRPSRIFGRQKGRRINQPTHAKTHGWALMSGLSNCLSSASGKHRRRVMYRSRKTPVKQALFSTLISSTSERSRRLGHGPRSSRRFPGDHRVATMPLPGRKIDKWTKIPASGNNLCQRPGGEKTVQRTRGTYPGPAKPPRSCAESARPLAMMPSRLLVTNSRGMPWLSRLRANRSLTRAWRCSISGDARRSGRHRSGARPHRSACQLRSGRRPSGNRPRRPSTGRRRHRAE